MKAETSASW